nr:cdc42 effector protein 1-like isoform X2 [Anser cygnoides]
MERGWRRGPGSVYRAGTGPGQGRGAAAVPPGGPRARPRVAEPRPGGPVWLPARVGNSSVYGGPVPAGLAAGRALGAFRDAGCHLAPSGISRPVGGAPRGAAETTVLAYVGRYPDGGNEQPGREGDGLSISFC